MPVKTTPKAKRGISKPKITRKRAGPVKKLALLPVIPAVLPLVTHKPASLRQSKMRYWQWLVYATATVVVLLVIGTGTVLIILQTGSRSQPELQQSNPTPATVGSPLTGLPTSAESASRRPWAVVVSNLVGSRPQTGLSLADVVFEAPAEGGITRYLVVFQSQLPTRVGPVRSARPYFNDWASNFSALYSHSGGSTEALKQLEGGYGSLQDVNEFSNSAAYERDPSKKAPHNLFTGSERFWNYTTSHNWLGFKGFIPFVFGNVRMPGVGTTNFTIPYEPDGYQVRYDWDPKNQNYLRSVGGKLQTDAANNVAITTKNVVIMVTDIVPMLNDPQFKVTITTLGSGRIILLRDGYRYEGRWAKPTLEGPLTFTDTAGGPLPLTPGNTWISVIDHATESLLSRQLTTGLELVP